MKKLIIFLFIAIGVSSCYDDYIKDFDFTSTYFTYQTDVRSIVLGEDSTFKLGVVVGGLRENTKDREVSFVIDPTLINPSILYLLKAGNSKAAMTSVSVLQQLPSNYYTLSDDSKFIIKSGNLLGTISIKLNSNFLSDAASFAPNYAIPLRITQTGSIDSILPDKNYTVVAIKYESMLFGNYWHGGVTTRDSAGVYVKPITYYTAIPSNDAQAWALTSSGLNSVTANGVSAKSSSLVPEISLTLNSDGKIIVSEVAGATYKILPDGESTFNKAKLLQNRKIFLSYKYNVGNIWYYAKDTLTFRNRIRDGFSEWQDENPDHYK
ncbi:MAG: DUF1735 domain-containing protein [Paludibacter sp.]|nr:DUF1735 domain-containing protein [Paludibacter sp.]